MQPYTEAAQAEIRFMNSVLAVVIKNNVIEMDIVVDINIDDIVIKDLNSRHIFHA